ncbi:Uncharacterised protein [Streptococcus pneumoniae]|nr:Uncharacterised protein [Streptococcus pneumoniae]
MDINHLVFNKTEFLFNQNKWQKEDSFESNLHKILMDKIQKSELSYSDLMSLLLYDAMNQSTFLTDSELFEDILSKIEDSHNTLLQVLSSYCCMRFLLVTITTGKKRLIKLEYSSSE